MLTIDKKIEDGKATLSPAGRIDTVTAPDLEKAVKDIIPEITELTLDFEKVDYISSAGLRVLLSAEKAMSGKGGMTIVNVNCQIMEIFDITGFSEFLTIG